jgi:hypothetical protein
VNERRPRAFLGIATGRVRRLWRRGWRQRVALVAVTVLLAVLAWQVTDLAVLLAQRPSLLPGFVANAVIGLLQLWMLHRIFRLTDQNVALQRRVTQLETFQRLATAAGEHQERLIEQLIGDSPNV